MCMPSMSNVMLFGLANDSLAILFLIQVLPPIPINNDPQMVCLIMYENPNHVMIVLKLQKTMILGFVGNVEWTLCKLCPPIFGSC